MDPDEVDEVDEVDEDVLLLLDGPDPEDADDELRENEVGGPRSTRLPDYGTRPEDHELYADAVSPTGAAVAPEESAVHVTGDDG
jgi:hypothetical protein